MAKGAKKFFAAAAAEREAIEAAKPKSWESDPFNKLDVLLIMELIKLNHKPTFRDMMSGKPRSFLDRVIKLVDKTQLRVVESTLRPILRSADPYGELHVESINHVALSTAVDQFVAEKRAGLLIHNGNIYPVRLFAEQEENYQWMIKNEQATAMMAAHVAAQVLGVKEIVCHVMFFAHWGFSSVPRLIRHNVENIHEVVYDEFAADAAQPEQSDVSL